MDRYNPLLEKVIYAFQDERIVRLVGEICGIKQLEPDAYLYAGGISLMAEKNFLNPHLTFQDPTSIVELRGIEPLTPSLQS